MTAKPLININYPYCSSQKHTDQYSLLTHVCISEKCDKIGLICSSCDMQNHKDHDLIDFSDFLKLLIKEKEKIKEGKNLDQKLYQELRERVRVEVENIRNRKLELTNIFNELQIKYKYLYDCLNNQSEADKEYFAQKSFKTLQELTLQLLNQKPFLNQMKDDINSLVASVKRIDQQLVFKLKSQQILEQLETLPKKILLSVQNIKSAAKDYQKTFQKVLYEQKFQYFTWSQNLKGSYISISNNSVSRNAHSDWKGGLVLMHQALSSSGITSWGIRVENLVNTMCLGIASRDLTKKNQFNINNYASLGHGVFMLSFNGFKYHNSDSNINNKNGSFGFNTGDTIWIEYDSKNKTLKFKKNKSNVAGDNVTMNIPECLQNDSYHISVFHMQTGNNATFIMGKRNVG